MPRIPDFNDKFLYTKTNPNNIIAAKKGALFFRRHHRFYLNLSGNLDSDWILLPYKTVVLPVPDADKPIYFEQQFEVWEKNSDGLNDELGYTLPKTDWTFFSNDDIFISSATKGLHWIFPVPTSSSDPIGGNNDRSYDENFFYAKLSGSWVRTPITTFIDPTPTDSGEIDYWYNNLPFVDYPRRSPRPTSINDSGLAGDQSYDYDYFYVNPSKWKRTLLTNFSGSKMTTF